MPAPLRSPSPPHLPPQVLSLNSSGTGIARGRGAAELRCLAMRTLSHFSTGTRGTLRPMAGAEAAGASFIDGEWVVGGCVGVARRRCGGGLGRWGEWEGAVDE
jgi:hypothetical protein